MNFLDEVAWDDKGLVPVIAQEVGTGDVLMFAWMNREALAQTAALGRAVYFSRSRAKLWPKGEESGNVQKVHDIRMDCDSDVLLLKVTQLGPGGNLANPVGVAVPTERASPATSIACHTGRHSCFFKQLVNNQWEIAEPVLKDPATIYT
jgi:phosphoribosyl-AMP cyclohydrolase